MLPKTSYTLRICMLGPKGSGKTSFLAAVPASMQSDLENTGVFLRYTYESAAALHNAAICLWESIGKDKEYYPALPRPMKIEDYEFELGGGGQIILSILVRVHPQEILASNQYVALTTDFVESADVIMFSIDTPCLMEEDGLYNQARNHPEQMIDLVKNNVGMFRNKLVMLMPLRCERYFHEDRMRDVAERIKTVYSELIQICRLNNVAAILAPAQTSGGLVFDHMTDDSPFYSLTEQKSKCPVFSTSSDNPRYQPMFCAQPMYHAINYAANKKKWEDENGSNVFLRKLALLGRKFPHDKKSRVALNEIRKNMLYDKFGYDVLTNNSILSF